MPNALPTPNDCAQACDTVTGICAIDTLVTDALGSASLTALADLTALRAVAIPTDKIWRLVENVSGFRNIYIFDTSETSADDGWTYIAPNDGTTGRWVLAISG